MFDSFKAFYSSYLHHPLLLFVGPTLLLFLLVPRLRYLRGYLVAFAIISLVDALVTGPLIAWTQLSGPPKTFVVVLFVILGDLRYFMLVEHFVGSEGARSRARELGVALALSLVVPLAAAIPIATNMLVALRHIFLCYEVMFLVFALVLRLLVLPRRLARGGADEGTRRWLLLVTHFVIAHYALWAISDVTILGGYDAGYALRLVPNLMYYGAFLPYVYLTSPRELR
ncbi:MAG: hypothetical protein KC503_11310 [Myxococcales bacterium]|nr:hypothetical protein [Myxococcales bacterium]